MALTYRQKRRWALILLLIGLPLYVVAATTLAGLLPRANFWLELAIYIGLGFLWALPFRRVFQGIGQKDPDAANHDR